MCVWQFEITSLTCHVLRIGFWYLSLNSSRSDIDWGNSPLRAVFIIYGVVLVLLETILDLLSELLNTQVWHSLGRKTLVMELSSELEYFWLL